MKYVHLLRIQPPSPPRTDPSPLLQANEHRKLNGSRTGSEFQAGQLSAIFADVPGIISNRSCVFVLLSGLGCVLMQEGRPIAFASRTLSKSEVKYAQIEKELLAITFACDRFHFYLYAREFTVESDHKPLESLILNGWSRHHKLTQNPYRPIQTSQSQNAAVGSLGPIAIEVFKLLGGDSNGNI